MKSRTVPHVFLPTLAWILAIVFSSSAFAQEISASNTSRPLGNGRWEWTVYINASPQVLSQIDCVEYTLHPTFPRPVQTICAIGDNRSPFGLSATGWGEFQIRIRVFMKDRHVVELTHDLKL
jgi:transcription initiation factor IIF auxiliary subunit